MLPLKMPKEPPPVESAVPWCYNEVAGKWNKDAEKGTHYEKIRDAQESLKALDKYRKKATIRELHKIDDHCLSVDELTWDNMIKALD